MLNGNLMLSMKKQDEFHSMNILISGFPGKETGLPSHIAKVIGDAEFLKDESSREMIEHELEKISFSESSFEDDLILEGTRFITWQKGHDSVLSPDISLIKQEFENKSLINFVISNFSDLEILKAIDEISFILHSLSGIIRRIDMQEELSEKNEENKTSELKRNLNKMGQFYNWQIFTENSMRERGIEQIGLAPMLISAILLRVHVLHDEIQCIGECKKTYNKDTQIPGVSCDCGGELLIAPPYIKIKNASFAFPSGLNEIMNVDEVTPTSLLNLIQQSMFPKNFGLIFNHFPDLQFSSTIAVPASSYYRSKSTNDTIKIIFEYISLENDDLLIFSYITDTRFSDNRLIPAASLAVIMREIQKNVKGEIDWASAIAKSELREWKTTSAVGYDEILQHANLKSMIQNYQEGDKNE